MLVPSPLTGEQWERVCAVIPSAGRSDCMDMRLLLEGVLHKLREGIAWKDVPKDRWPSWRPVYNRSREWLEDGTWKAVIEALGSYEGTEIPPAYQLPPLHVTGTFSPRLMGTAIEMSESGDAFGAPS
ncbi:transposase [Streptomyces sp. NPDC050738]|uniref:transposase n=1 Tax=Streptomyces sp. NPDC050738 TaxID=3154744 RepID=UPI00343358FA